MNFVRPTFTELKALRPFSAGMGDKSTIAATGKGLNWITLPVQKEMLRFKLQNVLFVPELSYQLFPIRCVDKESMVAALEKTKFANYCRIAGLWPKENFGTGYNIYIQKQTNVEHKKGQAMLVDIGL